MPDDFEGLRKLQPEPFAEQLTQAVSNYCERSPWDEKLPDEVWQELCLKNGIMLPSVPQQWSQRITSLPEIMDLHRRCGEIDLGFALHFGIVSGLVSVPVINKGTPGQQERMFTHMLQGERWGLGGTEAFKSGSTVLRLLRSHFQHTAQGIIVNADKRPPGNSGKNLLMLLREKGKGCFHWCMVERQHIQTELEETLGLRRISYGRNWVNKASLGEENLLPAMGLKDVRRVFFTTRLCLIGMMRGAVQRCVQIAEEHAHNWMIGRMSLENLPIARSDLEQIRAIDQVVEAFYRYVCEEIDHREDLSDRLFEANTIKAFGSELMHRAADIAAVQQGNLSFMAYDQNEASRYWRDTRGFTIFEGPNDKLYDEMQAVAAKEMKEMMTEDATMSLITFLEKCPTTRGFLSVMEVYDQNFSVEDGTEIQIAKIHSQITGERESHNGTLQRIIAKIISYAFAIKNMQRLDPNDNQEGMQLLVQELECLLVQVRQQTR